MTGSEVRRGVVEASYSARLRAHRGVETAAAAWLRVGASSVADVVRRNFAAPTLNMQL